MIISKINDFKLFLYAICLFLIIRIFFLIDGLILNNFTSYWQIANIDLLYKDLFKTIYYFHYQPPLWNLLIGFILKITNGNQEIGKYILLFFHWFLSIGIIFFIYKIQKKIKFNKIIYVAGLLMIILNPSIIFYENFPLYNHLSCFIFFLIFYNFYSLSHKKKFKYEFFILILSLILTLTWTLFHPFFLIIIYFLILYIKKQFEKKTLIVCSLFFLITLIPSIKNYYEFNFFGNGSGLGQNMSGLIYWNTELRDICDYRAISFEKKNEKKIELKHQILSSKYHTQNSLLALNKSKFCLENSIYEIKNNFTDYFFYRLRVLLASHNRFSFEYFQPPVGFQKYFIFLEEAKKNQFSWIFKKVLINMFFMSYYLIIFFYFFKINDNQNFKKASLCIFILHLYILLIGTFLNNQEQERFRYTSGIYLNFLFTYIIIKFRSNLLKILSFNV